MTKLNFFDTVRKMNMDSIMKDHGTVIVGYSGGADSSCLLRMISSWASENGVSVHAAHINHMIRGKEADRDEEFCRKICRELGIPFHSSRIDVPALSAESGKGLEEAARNVRYSFFSELSEQLTGDVYGAVIATAHNSNDNLETVLMNMIRGSGLNGMCGIAPVREGRIIRPLIKDSSENIRQWCRENGVEYVVDSTNAELDCTRNIVRNRIVPLLGELSSSPEVSVSKMSDLLRTDSDYLDNLADEIIGDRRYVSRETVVNSHPAVTSRVLRGLYDLSKDSDSTITGDQILEILRLAREKNGFSTLSLPGNMRALIDRDRISFECTGSEDSGSEEYVFERTADNGFFENSIYRVRFLTSAEYSENGSNINKLSIIKAFDCDKIKGALKIRYKKDGDSYVFGGHTRKLKKLFTDSKLSDREKKMTPVICDDNGILWVPGFPQRDGTVKTSERCVYIEYLKKSF